MMAKIYAVILHFALHRFVIDSLDLKDAHGCFFVLVVHAY
jgi:hypothetical protein